ncbi:MAG TPA: hypothetical protein VFK14_12370 [Solirubrobacterales bacterium]|nr:hypothetical protein [Solirubrobacterales bacterium]
MSRLPTRIPDGGRLDQLAQATLAQQQIELAIFNHHLQARYVAECERIDAEALSDVMRTSLEEELSVLTWGMEEAAGSAAKAELVSRKVALLSQINNRRIARRFGR